MSRMNAALGRMKTITDQRAVRRSAELGAMVMGAAAVLALGAHAGQDSTFNGTTTTLTNWVGGSGGKLAAVAAIGVGIFGAILRFDWKLIAGAAGIGLAAATGPAIVSGLVTATF